MTCRFFLPVLFTAVCAVFIAAPLYGQVREAFDSEAIDAEDAGRAATGHDAIAEGIVARTNDFRGGEKEKRAAIRVSEKLEKTAAYFASYMAMNDRYGHTADGKRPAERAKDHNYEFCIVSENIAYRYSSVLLSNDELAARFFTGWRESPGHRENMLDPDVTETGVAVGRSEETGYYYAVQMFGRPKSAAIEFSIANRSGKAIEYRIGESAFELPARYTRIHHQCRPPALALLAADDPERAVATARPKSGERVVVKTAGGALRLERQ